MSYTQVKLDSILSDTTQNIRALLIHQTTLVVVPFIGKVKLHDFYDLEKPEELISGCVDTLVSGGGRLAPNLEYVLLSEQAHLGGLVSIYKTQRLRGVGALKSTVLKELDTFSGEGSTLDVESYSKTLADVGNENWISSYSLVGLAEGNPLEVYFKSLESGSSEETESETVEEVAPETPEPTETEKSKEEERVLKYFNTQISGTVNALEATFDLLFSSGFEVIKPYGVIARGTGPYPGVTYRLSGNSLAVQGENKFVQEIYKRLEAELQLVEVDVRSTEQIARVLVTGYTSEEHANSGVPALEGNLYFPKKMLEYAYGREKPSGLNQEANSTFPNHSKASSWTSYKNSEVLPSIRQLAERLVIRAVTHGGWGEDGKFQEQACNEAVVHYLNKLKSSLGTCILLSKIEELRGEVVTVKLRVNAPAESLWRTRENLVSSILTGLYGFSNESKSRSCPVVTDESVQTYKEYTHEVDQALSNSEPIFAYKALEALKERGEQISWDNVIVGLDTQDRILIAGGEGQIDLRQNLTHFVAAGSRSGKGVKTLNWLASCIASRRALFYLDDKPDMASLMKMLSPQAFAVNGAAYISGDGSDYFNTFNDRDSLVSAERTPTYIQESFGTSYDSLGALYYTKAAIITMSIIAARASDPQLKELLGGDEGIVIIADELLNADKDLGLLFQTKSKQNLNIGTDEVSAQLEMKAYEEAKARGEKVTKPVNTPSGAVSPASVWFVEFVKKLESSLNTLTSLSNAGLKNSEAKVSDIFILSQELFTPQETVLPLRNKTTPKHYSQPITGYLPKLFMPTEADVFLGYNKKHSQILNQGSKSSPASVHLNAEARKFAYLPTFSAGVSQEINQGRGGHEHRAVYFKPFLLFPDGKHDSYFVQNMLDTMPASVDRRDIIARNEDPNNPGQIHPAVGFREYLNTAGISNSEITATLNKAGEIVQKITDALGYPGTWEDFIYDLRPEWIFSIEEIVNILRGYASVTDVNKRLPEFSAIYPELLTIQQAGGAGEAIGGFSEFSDFSNGGFSELEVSEEDYQSPITDFDPETFEETYEEAQEQDLWSPNPYNAPIEVENSSGDLFEEDVSPVNLPTPGEYGQGTAPNPFGPPTNFEIPAPARVSAFADTGDPLVNVAQMTKLVTNSVITSVGGFRNLSSIKVLGGSGGALIVNGALHRIDLSPETLRTLPTGVAAEISAGNLARYFDWNILRKLPNLVDLSADSANFVQAYISPGIQIGTRVSVDLIFERLIFLQTFGIGNKQFTRASYKADLQRDNTFYQPTVRRQALDVADNFLWESTGRMFRYSWDTLGRRDVGAISKALLVTSSLFGGITAGTASVAVKGGRFATKLFQKARAARDVWNDSKDI